MDDYTLHLGHDSYRLAGTQLDAVRVGARMIDRWHQGLPVTFATVDGDVTLQPPRGWPHLPFGMEITGPWKTEDDNPWSTPGAPDRDH